jgi:hypothetical protein
MLGGAGSGRAWGSNTYNPRHFVSTYNTKGTIPLRWATPQSRTGLWKGLGLEKYYTDVVWSAAQEFRVLGRGYARRLKEASYTASGPNTLLICSTRRSDSRWRALAEVLRGFSLLFGILE